MLRQSRSRTSRAPRLRAEDWVDAALLTMGKRGIANVRVEQLARDLKVTKGSFYWHFKDRDALLDAMLVRFQERSSDFHRAASIVALPPVQQLRAMLEAPQKLPDAVEGVRMELAIRLWARRSDHVRDMLHDIDRSRSARVLALLKAAGCNSARARQLLHQINATSFYLWTRDQLSATERRDQIDLTMAMVSSAASAPSGG